MYITSAGSRSWLLIVITGIIFAEKLTKNSTSGAFQQTPIKHHRIVIANVGLQYRWTGHVSRKENEVISNDIWLINIHELVSTHTTIVQTHMTPSDFCRQVKRDS